MNEVRKRLLVVDDDRLVLATLVTGLRSGGFEVVEADNGDDAILLARSHKPDLALLDIRMQGKSGLDVARYLRANTSVPFMFLSAFNDAATVNEAAGYGALGYLVKPLDIRQVIPAVHAALERSAEARGPHVETVEKAAPSPEEAQTLWFAVGLIAERHHLGVLDAIDRIEREASTRQTTPEALAAELVRATELLNMLGKSRN